MLHKDNFNPLLAITKDTAGESIPPEIKESPLPELLEIILHMLALFEYICMFFHVYLN